MEEQKKTFDYAKLAKYPFLKEAKECVSSMKINLAELPNHPLYSEAIEGAKQRIKDRMNGKHPQRRKTASVRNSQYSATQ